MKRIQTSALDVCTEYKHVNEVCLDIYTLSFINIQVDKLTST